MFKKIFIILVSMTIILSACASTPSAPLTRETTIINNDLAGGSVQFRHTVESFVLVTEFSTPDPIEYWHITEPKLILMRAWIEEGGDNCEVLVEHVHADAFIMSRYSGWDGIITDSMDDKIHSSLQPGFWITSTYKYEEIFSVEGYSQELYTSWTIFYNDFIAKTNTKPEPMTEENLIKIGGTQGQKFQVVWNLAIRCNNETLYHTKAIVDHFTVPISQNVQANKSQSHFRPTPIGNP